MGSLFFTSVSGWIASILLGLENPNPLPLAPDVLERPSELATELFHTLPPSPLAALLGGIFAPRTELHARMDSHAGTRLSKACKYIWPVVCNRWVISVVASADARLGSAGFGAPNPQADSRLALPDNARSESLRSRPRLAQLMNLNGASFWTLRQSNSTCLVSAFIRS
jgi:hypothetical protein